MAKSNIFFQAIGNLKRRINPYTKIKSIDEIDNIHILNYHDLSKLDLREHMNLFTWSPDNKHHNWTENVIWPSPDKMPPGFDPIKILNESMAPRYMENLHAAKRNGKGINIAIIDMTLDKTNPEFNDKIKFYSVSKNIQATNTNPSMHGSLVACRAVGTNTGSAPAANLYYFEATRNPDISMFDANIDALIRVLEYQKSAPPTEKINILSCSFGLTVTSSGQPANIEQITTAYKIIQQLHDAGIKVITCQPKQNTPQATQQRAQIESALHRDGFDDIHWCDEIFSHRNADQIPTSRFLTDPALISIPTRNMSHINYKHAKQFNPDGGDSSAAPYLAGVYACVLQNNQIFCTRPNWQDELDTILRETATKHPLGGLMINPDGIYQRVSQITREMEINLIKTKSMQNE